ncbi:MAG: ATP-binding protein [Prevotella sp.]|nr:ATP-binding protein [Prevotella sp.]
MIERTIERQLAADTGRRKVIVITGARQVGKTTLVNALAAGRKKVLMLNCDNHDDRAVLEDKTTTQLGALMEGYDLVFIDEAQRVPGIGLTIKMIGDMKPDTQVIATGSSSLELAEGINEPATGRHIDYMLFPLSLEELAAHTSEREERRMLGTRLIYGTYPEVVTQAADARRTLMTLASDYLYKDLLAYRGVKKPEVLSKLLRALALQVGSEVSYNELSGLLGIDKATVESYIGLLEKCFVIFRLDSFSRNARNEIKKGKKIYFCDNGIRNAIISNFAPPEMRTDMGALWENLMISERRKRNIYHNTYSQMYFWRTHEQKEIDLVEETDGMLHAYDFKWNGKARASLPAVFASAYPGTVLDIVTPDNYFPFITHP